MDGLVGQERAVAFEKALDIAQDRRADRVALLKQVVKRAAHPDQVANAFGETVANALLRIVADEGIVLGLKHEGGGTPEIGDLEVFQKAPGFLKPVRGRPAQGKGIALMEDSLRELFAIHQELALLVKAHPASG